jgi:hypothetical protein
MKILLTLALASILGACASTSPVLKNSDGSYSISKVGGWGYDLGSLKAEVKQDAANYAKGAGKTLEIVSESVQPETQVGVYPAYDDTYSLTFKLVEKDTQQIPAKR